MARKFTIPIALVGGVVLGLAEMVRKVATTSKDMRLAEFIHSWTGYWYPSNTWKLGVNGGGMATLACVAGAAIHYGVGTYGGVNKALGRANVPIIRL